MPFHDLPKNATTNIQTLLRTLVVDYFSLFTFHFSLFAFHFSLFAFHRAVTCTHIPFVFALIELSYIAAQDTAGK